MVDTKLRQVLSLLPVLNQSELATVKTAAEQLLVSSGAGSDEPDLLYDALISALNVKLPYSRLSSSMRKAWDKNAPIVVQFMEVTWPVTKEQKIMRLAMMKFLINLVIDELKAQRVPISLGTVITNLHRIEEIFDRHFPSYRESGLSGLIIKAMERK